MRRRYVLALVLATALIFTLAGIAVGYWVLPEGQSACEAARNRYLDGLGTPGITAGQLRSLFDYQKAVCD